MSEHAKPDRAELLGRIDRLQNNLVKYSIDAALFVYEIDRYYLSATLQSGYVLVPARGEPVAFVRKSFERAKIESPLNVVELPSIRKLPELVKAALGRQPENLGVEFDVLPHAQLQRLAGMFEGVPLKDVSHALALTRAVKTPYEIEMISGAARIIGDAVAEVAAILKPGLTEIELAARVEYEMRRRGHGGFTPMRSFNQRLHYGHIFAGETAAEPGGYDMPTVGRGLGAAAGQGPSRRAILPGEPIVVDVVGHFNGYLCDQTRMFSIGEPDRIFLDAFEAAKRIQTKVAAAAKPGVKSSELFAISEQAANDEGLAEHYLGQEYKVTFVGHGIGLEVDEYPFLAKGFDLALEEGMVFALEPKFIFKGRAAVGIEDTYVVRPGGAERLTVSEQRFIVVG